LIEEEIKRRLKSGNACYYSIWNSSRLLVGKPTGKRPLGGCIIIKLIFDRKDWVVWTGLIRPRIQTSGGSCEHDNETLGSAKCSEVLE
jgi:hypothetical protein